MTNSQKASRILMKMLIRKTTTDKGFTAAYLRAYLELCGDLDLLRLSLLPSEPWRWGLAGLPRTVFCRTSAAVAVEGFLTVPSQSGYLQTEEESQKHRFNTVLNVFF